MPRLTRPLALALLATVFVGCSSNRVLAPPRLDLSNFGTLGLIEFASAPTSDLGPAASREFLSNLQAAQPGVPVLELGPQGAVLGAVGRPALDIETVQAIGKRFGVDALLVGVLDAKEVSPKFSVESGARLSAGADIEGSLSARLLDTTTGATLWTTATHGRQSVARVDVSREGLSGIGGRDPQGARAILVQDLVTRATADLWPRWVSP